MPDLILERVDIMSCPFRLWNNTTKHVRLALMLHQVKRYLYITVYEMLSKTTEVYYTHVP